MTDELERKVEEEEGERVQELMDDALPEQLEDKRIDEEKPQDPGLDAV